MEQDAKIFAETGLKVLRVKFDKSSKVIRQMFYKQHIVREPCAEKPIDRTLFVINIPPYCDEDCMKRLFEKCGKVDHVYFHKTPTSSAPPEKQSEFFPVEKPFQGYKVAYLVFEKPSYLKAALDKKWSKPRILYPDGDPIIGMEKWYEDHIRKTNIRRTEMQAEINSYMEEYDKTVQLEKETGKRMKNTVDEDGWLDVTAFNKKVIRRREVLLDKIKEKEEKKRPRKELKNFYTFQIREAKMKDIADLRKKFEDDKQRIALMKATKSFNPFTD